MTDLVLFGAGASAYSGRVVPEPPPLGADLFAKLQVFPRWADLPREAIDQFIGPGGFEPGFVYLREHLNLDARVPGLLRDMGLYFLSFRLGEGNLYARYANYVRAPHARIITATLNYDMLLEQAFRAVRGFGYSLSVEAKVPVILKVHGSPNILPALVGDGTVRMAGSDFNVVGPARAMREEEAKVLLQRADAFGNDAIAPCIALYAPNKPVLYCPIEIQMVQREYAHVAQQADRIFVVGARRVEDHHIWEPIANSDAHVFYVNPGELDSREFVDWARVRGVRYEHVDGGFSEFLDFIEMRPR